MIRPSRTPPPPREWTATWLVTLTAATMGFLASLGFAAVAAADALARSWTTDLESSVTISIALPPDVAAEDGRAEDAMARALDLIRADPRVESAEALAVEDIEALLEPWLGDAPSIEDLALPRLVDVALLDAARPSAETVARELETRLLEAGFEAEADSHGEWVARLAPAAARIRGLAYAALGVLAAAAGLTVALACAASLSAQSAMVDVLKLIGATDSYVARIFVRRAQILVFVGSAVGAGLAALALALGAEDPDPSGLELAPLAPRLAPMLDLWPWFILAPLGFALIATLSAYLTVMLSLRRRTM